MKEQINIVYVAMKLPTPDPLALAHSEKLLAVIFAAIESAGGQIPFADYMQLALYAPGLGYYTAGAHKIGEGGDFVTAPELSILFSYCVAEYSRQILERLAGGAILEFGAGSGVMARDILLYLQQHHSLPEQYFIIEISPDLKARQKQLLQTLSPEIFARVVWLEALPTRNFKGIVLANEVLDAMPVSIFYRTQQEILERYVKVEEGRLVWYTGPPCDPQLVPAVLKIEQDLGQSFAPGYTSEVNLWLEPWIRSVAAFVEQGEVLIMDYGFLQSTYYHPQRSMGTLMCHYRQHAHMDPFLWPGLQDLTAHVDFSALGQAGEAAGFKVQHMSHQARFLLAAGLLTIMEEVAQGAGVPSYILAQQVKKLTSPSEMGELFKVMALAKNMG